MMRWIERRPAGKDQEDLDASVLPAGSYRHFLTRYPEGNALYSKMMYTSLLVNQIRGGPLTEKDRPGGTLEGPVPLRLLARKGRWNLSPGFPSGRLLLPPGIRESHQGTGNL